MNTPDLSAWKIDAQKFPQDGEFAEKIWFILRYAILAPSIHNTQPWRFEVYDDCLKMFVDRSKTLLQADPYNRQLIISCGAALMNLRVAAAYFNFPIEIDVRPHQIDSDEMAMLRPSSNSPINSFLSQLFPAIMSRVTNRHAYAPVYISRALQAQLIAAAQEEGANLVFIETTALRQQIAELIIAGDLCQFHDPNFRQELANWMRDTHSQDGIPSYALGIQNDIAANASIMQLALRMLDISKDMAHIHQELLQSSPVLACLVTASEDIYSWLAVGQALQRVLLLAADSGFNASFLNQAIEIEELRLRLAKTLGLQAPAFPQMLLRLGMGATHEHTPRKSVKDVA